MFFCRVLFTKCNFEGMETPFSVLDLVLALAVVVALGLAVWPNALRLSDWDLAVLPFALIFLGAFLAPALDPGARVAPCLPGVHQACGT